ncbi:Hypothetical predicted protein [Pelobates cultripes]|uniref:Uncharacterized protein n=1 Tax=Pelobates cultripes TaxID=61616 RepID=A0AAD1RCE4_PELCU|nr:Hypothetical predicted protein [Pelobates cultripes]
MHKAQQDPQDAIPCSNNSSPRKTSSTYGEHNLHPPKTIHFIHSPINHIPESTSLLVTLSALSQVTTTGVGVISWLDHADISLTLQVHNLIRPWTWKLNPLLLHDIDITESIAKDLTDYFELNASIPDHTLCHP